MKKRKNKKARQRLADKAENSQTSRRTFEMEEAHRDEAEGDGFRRMLRLIGLSSRPTRNGNAGR